MGRVDIESAECFLSFQKKTKEVLLILCMLLKFYVSVNNQEKRFNGERLKMLFFHYEFLYINDLVYVQNSHLLSLPN